jgi:GxxExxY protein
MELQMFGNEDPVSQRVIGCGFEVSNNLGCGYLESVYENALCLELQHQGVAFERQKPLSVTYKGETVGKYVTDLIVEDRLLVELKALSRLTGEHEAQVMNYLRATGLGVGLLLNFGTPRLGIKRIVWQHNDAISI